MDSDQGKLFIGGISWETNEENLKDHFGKYGDVMQTIVMRDKITGKPRGFAFVAFSDPSIVDTVLQDQHIIDGREVEAKRALSREEQQTSSRTGCMGSGRNPVSGGGGMRTKKIFVGGLPATLTEDGFRDYFEAYGRVTDVVVMYDQNTQRPRGFGFISFENEESVDRVLHKTFHDLNGKQVEVKRALPKDATPPGTSRQTSGGSSGTGGGSYHQGYGGNAGQYDGRMDSSRYMQPQNPGGFSSYGSGFPTTGYGYGHSGDGMGFGGFGGYGAYGGGNPGYGGGNPNYGTGQGSGGYGNTGVPNTGYTSGHSSGQRGSWGGSQSQPGYGAVGYGNPNSWGGNTGGSAAAAASMGPGPGSAAQSPGGAGYGNQVYSSIGYNDGSYSSSTGYGGGVGSHGIPDTVEAAGSGYASGGGYNEINGNQGYNNNNTTWGSEQSQGPANYGGLQYGGGYGGRPSQQQ